jgi:hypothetical protein
MKSRVWRSLFLVVLIAICSQGVSAGIISDFDDGTVQGWVADYALTPSVGVSQGTDYAVQVTRTDGGWNQSWVLSSTELNWSSISTSDTLQIDVRAQGGTDIPGWWLQIFPVLNSENGGWDMGSAFNVELNGQWATYTWTYPEQPTDPGQWGELFLVTQGGAGDTGMTFYVDQIGVVPEPSTFVLLGLGLVALAVFGRRRLARR